MLKQIKNSSVDFFSKKPYQVLIAWALLFLPFTYALTIQVWFPIKLTEIIFIILTPCFLIFYFLTGELNQKLLPNSFFKVLAIFFLLSAISFLVNLLWKFEYPLDIKSYRFGLWMNSLFKTGYILLIFFCCLFSYYSFKNFKTYVLKFLFVGAIISALYGWYLFIFSLNEWNVVLLPGMDDWPQHGLYSFGHFIRSGTFKEGNYAGLFLISMAFIALKEKRYYIFLFLLISVFPTVSIMAFLCIFLFLILISLIFLIQKKLIITIIAFTIVFSSITYYFKNNQDLNFALSKITIWKKAENPDAENSKNERLNLINSSFKMGLNNPIIGVGLANFDSHLYAYAIPGVELKETFKYIPNNVYLEIFAELGLTGLLVYTILLAYLIILSINKKDTIITCSLIVIYLYFMAYPTFSILFIWVFFGYVLAETLPEKEIIKVDKTHIN